MASFHARIAAAASRHPDRPAVELSTAAGRVETTTYAQLADAAASASSWLAEDGIQRGDRVALLARNHPDWVAAYLGILRLGAVAVPLDTAYGADQIRTIVADSGARILLTSASLRTIGDAACSGLAVPVRLADLADVTASRVGAAVPAIDVEDDEPAAILYTSGTTADPKGVVLTHGNLEAERAGALAVIHVSETDAVLGVLPLFHALAQMANLLLPLTTGARVVFLETIDSTTLVHALDAHGITVFACVPQFFYLIHQRVLQQVHERGGATTRLFRILLTLNFTLREHAGVNVGRFVFGRVHRTLGRRMRLLITGGSRFDAAIARDLYSLGLVLLNGYGLTETSGAATVMRPDDRFTTSVGQPLPGVEVKIRERSPHAGSGDGEILIRGPVVMREYFNRPDATAESLRDGWLHTGDLGRIDETGRVYITGRLKEIIVLSSGKNLYPEEIEAHYRQSDVIKELCVLGVTNPGEPSAERLHAIVVPDEDVMRRRGVLNYGELIRFEIETLSVRLPPHKRILSYDIRLDPLPRTTTGKLRRGEIARRQQEMSRTPDADTRPLNADETSWLAGGQRAELVRALAKRLGRVALAPDANLELDLGLDSMERVELLALAEERLGRRVDAGARAAIFTVRQLVEAVEAAPPHGEAGHDARGDPAQGWSRVLADPPDPDVTSNLTRQTLGRSLVVGGVLRAWLTLARLVVRFDVTGLDRLPDRGPYLIAPNHQSHLDGFVLCAVLRWTILRQVFLVGAAEYFGSRFTRLVARLLNIVPVDPDANLLGAMRAAAAGLRLGKILVLFPEGERSIDGRLRPFRKGAAILASELNVPVVPVALAGLYELWPRAGRVAWSRLRPWRRPRVIIRFGEPLRLDAPTVLDATRRLEQRVRTLLETASESASSRA